jgi:hypothetical protein
LNSIFTLEKKSIYLNKEELLSSVLKELLIITLCTILVSCGRKKTKTEFELIIIDKELNSNLFNSTEFMLNPLTLKAESGYDNFML